MKTRTGCRNACRRGFLLDHSGASLARIKQAAGVLTDQRLRDGSGIDELLRIGRSGPLPAEGIESTAARIGTTADQVIRICRWLPHDDGRTPQRGSWRRSRATGAGGGFLGAALVARMTTRSNADAPIAPARRGASR